MTSHIEAANAANYEISAQLKELQMDYSAVKVSAKSEKESNKILKEVVEVQKEALAEASNMEEENKKLIRKLKGQLSKAPEPTEDKSLEYLQQEISRLERECQSAAKLKEKLRTIKEENSELRDLLKDKEQLADTVEYLIEENKRYRKQKEEMEKLLDDANRTASELRGTLEESLLELNSPRMGRNMSPDFGRPRGESIADIYESDTNSPIRTFEGDSLSAELSQADSLSTELSQADSLSAELSQAVSMEKGDSFSPKDLSKEVSFQESRPDDKTSEAEKVSTDSEVTNEDKPKSSDSPRGRVRGVSWNKALTPKKNKRSVRIMTPPREPPSDESGKGQSIESSIRSNLENFRKKAQTFALNSINSDAKSNRSKSKSVLAEKKYLLAVLDHKLKSAESRMGDLQINIDNRQDKEDLLNDLNHRLRLAEEQLQSKDQRILRLEERLAQTGNLKEGWLAKRGNILPFWRNRWCALSGVENRLYYSSNPTDHFRGMISLQTATVRVDTENETGRKFAFIIDTFESPEKEGHSYWLQASSEEVMNDWVFAIGERILRSKRGMTLDDK